MSDTYYAAVLSEVWQRGGNPDAVSRTRVEMCEAEDPGGRDAPRWRCELQVARARVARDMARLNVVSK
jgi:hypothetical protein